MMEMSGFILLLISWNCMRVDVKRTPWRGVSYFLLECQFLLVSLCTAEIEESRLESEILRFIKSKNFALVLACLLMIVQSLHSIHALADLTTLTGYIKTVFSVSTAILMDCLIICFVANGDRKNSFVFFCFCALLNVYAYHIELDLSELLCARTSAWSAVCGACC